MFKDEVDFNYLINLFLPIVKEEKMKEFLDAIKCVEMLAGEDKKTEHIWTKEDLISELFFQLS